MLVDVVEGPSDPPLDTMKPRADGARRLPPAPRRARRRAPHARDRRRGDDALGRRHGERARRRRRRPAGHLVQVTVHRHGRIDPHPARRAARRVGRRGPARSPRPSPTTRTTSWCSGATPTTWRSPPTPSSRRAVVSRWCATARCVAAIELPIAGILSPLPAREVADAPARGAGRRRRASASAPTRWWYPAAVPGDALVAGLPARPARHRRRPHRRHDRGVGRHGPDLLNTRTGPRLP